MYTFLRKEKEGRKKSRKRKKKEKKQKKEIKRKSKRKRPRKRRIQSESKYARVREPQSAANGGKSRRVAAGGKILKRKEKESAVSLDALQKMWL